MQSLKIIRLLIHFFRYEKKQEESSLHVSHTVRNFEFFYEPFYISLDTAPPFDERFIGYGFTRNTQVGKILTLHIVLTKTLFRKSKTMKKSTLIFRKVKCYLNLTLKITILNQSGTGNALERVQRVHKPADLWDITF